MRKYVLFFLLFFSSSFMNAKNNAEFSIAKISDSLASEMITKKIWTENCPVKIERLRLLTISYYDFEGKIHADGKIMVLDSIAENVVKIFREIFEKKFPIAQMKLMNDFDGDDDLSMAANNSSAFMCREITGGGRISLHAYGVAIDVNPMQNPYIANGEIAPKKGAEFLDRKKIRAGMNEEIAEIFIKNGFTIWGGNWKDPIDYMHFQLERVEVEKLVK